MSHIFLVLDSLLRVFLPLSMIPLSDRLLLPLGSNDNGANREDEARHAARHRQDDLPRTDALAVTVVAVLASIVNKVSFMLLDLWRDGHTESTQDTILVFALPGSTINIYLPAEEICFHYLFLFHYLSCLCHYYWQCDCLRQMKFSGLLRRNSEKLHNFSSLT